MGENDGPLSARGRRMAGGGLAPYLQAHVDRRDDPGYVGLAVAENLLLADLLLPLLESFPPVPADVVAYADNAGRRALRVAIATMFEREVFGRPVDHDHVQVLAGASGILDALGHALGDPGDGVLVPTPSYSGFWPDLEIRPGLQMVPVPTSAADGFRLTPALLEQAWATAEVPVRILLLTNPDNPRGQVMPAEDVEAVLDWADAKGLHVIADEIYALSVHRPSSPAIHGMAGSQVSDGHHGGSGSDVAAKRHDGQAFPSVGRLRQRLGDRLHVVWAFSKDLGMSGLRAGVVITENDALRRAIELQGIWQGVSAHTQHVLAAMMQDDGLRDQFLPEMRGRLHTAATATTAALHDAEIPHLQPTAGFFVLCDLRAHLAEPTWEAEHALWTRLLDDAGVNLTPGSALRSPEPGWFRLCYAANPTDVVVTAVGRIGRLLRRMA